MPCNLPRTVVCCSLALLLSCAAVASAGTSNATNPGITFSTPGATQVSLEVCNRGGCNTIVKTVTVLDPMPAVVTFSVSPASLIQTAVIHLSGTGSGKPPLTFSWRVVETSTGTPVAAWSGATVDWTVSVPPGLYTASLTVNNSDGASATSSAQITVLLPPDWIFSDGFELGNRWVMTP